MSVWVEMALGLTIPQSLLLRNAQASGRPGFS
jgi:hypothetical protein